MLWYKFGAGRDIRTNSQKQKENDDEIVDRLEKYQAQRKDGTKDRNNRTKMNKKQ